MSISIHALREEGDARLTQRRVTMSYFYPRPPRGGRQEIPYSQYTVKEFLSTPSARRATFDALAARCAALEFLSTPSARRATVPRHRAPRPDHYFYPRPPRGGRQDAAKAFLSIHIISIHALREEGDQKLSTDRKSTNDFYPRPPRGGRP